MIEIFGTIAMVLAVAGVVLNNHRYRWCFVVWTVSNIITAAIHIRAGIFSMVVRDVIFIVLAWHGWIVWGKTENRFTTKSTENTKKNKKGNKDV